MEPEVVILCLSPKGSFMPRGNWSISVPGTVVVYNPRNETTPSSFSGAKDIASETITGVLRHKPKGWINPTNYSMVHKTTRMQQGRCDYVPRLVNGKPVNGEGALYVGLVGSQTGGRFYGENHFSSAVTEVDALAVGDLPNQALIAARNNLKAKKIDLGVAFAERKQTAMLLGDTASRLARSVNFLKRGRVRSAMDELGISSKKREPFGRNVPAKWMELQYGWKPFLSDVYGASAALNGREKSDWRVTARATRSRNQRYEKELKPLKTSNFDAHRCRAVVKRSSFCRIDALPQNEALISLVSLGVTNPLLVVWEKVPFSFVVDWALPIGNYLDSLDALLGYSTAFTSTSTLVKAEWVDIGLSDTFSTGGWTRNDFSGTKRIVSLSRVAQSGVPMPAFPRIKDPFSLGHMANGLALLSQAFGRR